MKTFLQKCSILTAIFYVISVFYVNNITCYSSSSKKYVHKNILIVHSYNIDFSWTKSLQSGLDDSFKRSNLNVITNTEFLDSNDIIYNKPYLNSMSNIFKLKFKNKHYDVIICCDNTALDFISSIRNTIFKNVPVVFCGINNFSKNLISSNLQNTTGIAETPAIKQTINFAFKVNPNINKIFVYGYNSSTYCANKSCLVNFIKKYKHKVSLNFKENVNIIDASKQIRNLDRNSIVIVLSNLKDNNDEYLPWEKTCSILSSTSTVPIYSFWTFALGHGILGGKLISGYTQGKLSAKYVISILNNKPISSLPIILKTPTSYMFDYNQLKKFKIHKSILPKNSILINRPSYLYSIDKYIFWAIVFIMISLVIFIVILLLILREYKKKQAEIQFLSYNDKLTGLYNRTYFDKRLAELDCEKYMPLSIISGDANGLKMVNDVFGHFEGDKLLCKIADILRKCCSKSDLISRWGGDEFIIVLPTTSQKLAMRVCEKIKSECAESMDGPIKPSISLGIATKYEVEEDIMSILKQAEERMYQYKLLEGRSARSAIISSLKETLFEKSHETEEHAERLKNMAVEMGRAINLNDNDLVELSLLALLHDIGKIGVSDRILNKDSSLSQEEWILIKKHPEIGYRIAQATPELAPIADMILSHHERWDGSGYPRGLKGEDIPLLSRIISIVDSFDVITHARSYKKGESIEFALNELKLCSGKQFDPKLVDIFIEIISKKIL